MLELLGAWKPLYSESSPKAFLEEDPTLVFLMETKFVVSEMTRIKRTLAQQQGLVVLSVRRGKGLALLWKSSMKVDVQTYSPLHIDVIITDKQSNKQWRFTGFYNHLKTNKREESWRLLEELSKRSDLPWICMGDFNEIMHGREKEGGNIRLEWQIRIYVKQSIDAT